MAVSKNETLKRIEVLQQECGISDVVFDGVKAANGWKNGRQVDENAFKAACSKFLNAPVDGRAPGKEAKG